ncbi:MAG: hypothetical protein IPG12_17085 [Saprospiraceae bacterium]|nr:hypothetical protein [Saprospiraceae bacterium]
MQVELKAFDDPTIGDSDNDGSLYFDGSYCAEVGYYNPNTVARSEYKLIVDVSNNELERIKFLQGWIDDSHFEPVEFDSDGFAELVDERGHHYNIQIVGEPESCFDYTPPLV